LAEGFERADARFSLIDEIPNRPTIESLEGRKRVPFSHLHFIRGLPVALGFPVIVRLKEAPAAEVLARSFLQDPYPFFLDSAQKDGRLGRFSFVGSRPFLVLRTAGGVTTIEEAGRIERTTLSPFGVLRKLLSRFKAPRFEKPVPFTGGAVGYFGYELCHFIEKLPPSVERDLPFPDMHLAFYDHLVAWDSLNGSAYLIAYGENAKEKLKILEAKLSSPAAPVESLAGFRGLQSNFTRDAYICAVEKAIDYIAAGDIFQVNLSQRFTVKTDVEPYALYERLRSLNPAPFAAYISLPEGQILSSSPERFLKLTGSRIQTRPIKGTRPRGRTPEEDEILSRQLLMSEKDNAELAMIVDLERNDIGRVSSYGSVKVVERRVLETYPTVFHLVATVEGHLHQTKDITDLLKATFPGGSITGAPKIRAMEIIRELEPTRRGIYTGAIGYIGFDGDMDLNIVIRTMLLEGGRAHFQVGGGIVADSDPETEYEETLHKGRALLQSLGKAIVEVPAER